MPTNKELADTAWAELTKTTDSYPAWKKKHYPSTSHWAHAKNYLDQIGPGPVPPDPVPPTAYAVKGTYVDPVSGWSNAFSAWGANAIVGWLDGGTLQGIASANGKAVYAPGHWDDGKGEFMLSDADAVADAKGAVATGGVGYFYVADEPSSQYAAKIKARSDLLKAQVPGYPTVVAYFDVNTLALFVGAADIFALDVYPSRFGFDPSLIPALAAKADSLGMRYWGVLGAFTDTNYPWPSASQLQAMLDQWKATRQEGWLAYLWNSALAGKADLVAVLRAG